MSRRYKPSKIWDYKRAEILSMPVAPVCYYQEDEILIEEIESKLEDACINEFVDLYKQHHKNYFKQLNSKVAFYSNGPNTSGIPLLFNEDFFKVYLEGRYYCRLNSFRNLNNYLVEAHYPNSIEYNKACHYLENFFGASFWEGSKLIYFKFVLNTNNNLK